MRSDMRRLREDIAEARRTRHEVRARLYAKWDEEGVWRPHWWDRLIAWVAALLGIYLFLWGEGTVDRVFAVGLVAVPAALIGVWIWMYGKALWLLRRSRR